MVNFYIDESGSMNNTNTINNPVFVIGIVVPKKPEKLRRVFRRFISSNIDELRELDNAKRKKDSEGNYLERGKMFDENGKFMELKGVCLTRDFKMKFIEYFCKNNLFEVYYVKIDNAKIKYGLYDNKARAFNYVLRLALNYYIRQGFIPVDDYTFQIDERNEKTNSVHFLQEYLNTELFYANGIYEHCINVSYFDSATNSIIQIADMFSNIMYSNCRNGQYKETIEKLKAEGYIKAVYEFPV